MKVVRLIARMVVGLGSCFVVAASYAGAPLVSFAPQTPTSATIAGDASATIQYVVTNQSSKSHSYHLRHVTGINQIVAGDTCPQPFVLAAHQSCILTLEISGKERKTNIVGGPTVCVDNKPFQCIQPAHASSLNIKITHP